VQLFPQGFPRGAHNMAGVSAHVIHNVATGRVVRPPMASRMSEPIARPVVGGRSSAFTSSAFTPVSPDGGGGSGERHEIARGTVTSQRTPPPRRRGGAVRARRDAALEGRHLDVIR